MRILYISFKKRLNSFKKHLTDENLTLKIKEECSYCGRS